MSAGDVYTYTPKQHHCMEGLAIENERGQIIDWFWSGDIVGNQVVSRDAEDLKLIANLNDYDLTARDGRESNKDYAPEDRLMIHSQHMLQRTHYIRKGAAPDLATKIENARQRLEEAESAARSARFSVEWAQKELAELEASA